MILEMDGNDDVQLNEKNFLRVCRLCLLEDVDFNISVFDRVDTNPNKRPLVERIHELYQIQVNYVVTSNRWLDKRIMKTIIFVPFRAPFQITKNDALPSNICHKCLFTTELFSEFRAKVQTCEQKLQKFVVLSGMNTTGTMAPIDMQKNDFLIDNSQVVVIDPTKCYLSSDEEECDGDDDENDAKPISDVSTDSLVLPKAKNDRKQSSADTTAKGFRNVYFCQYCESAYASQQECQTHETHDHDPVMPHVCNFCPFRGADRNVIIEHIKQVHGFNKPFVCVQCRKQFGRRSDLKKHAICHTGVRPFACTICPKSFSRNSNLQKHIKNHQGVQPFACRSCPLSFSSVHHLQRHEKSAHMESAQPFRCGKCPGSFPSYDALQQHERKHAVIKTNKTVKLMPPPSTAFNQHSAEYPLLSSALGVPVPLPTNHFVATQAKPMVRTTQAKILACDKCPRKFSKASALVSHMAIHRAVSTVHECQPCKKTFKTKRELQRHNLTHNGVKHFQCNTCGRRFARRDKLLRHENVHKNRKLAALPESAFLPENLKKHDSFYSSSSASSSLERRRMQPPIKHNDLPSGTEQQPQQQQQQSQQRTQLSEQQSWRPQFYAEYDLTETSNFWIHNRLPIIFLNKRGETSWNEKKKIIELSNHDSSLKYKWISRYAYRTIIFVNSELTLNRRTFILWFQ